MNTTTYSGCKPIVKWMQTTTRSWCKPIVVHASTYIGRDYLPTVGVGAQVAEAVASLCGHTCAFSRHCFW